MEALWLRKEGNTRAVILFHAYTGTPADVRMLAQFLHRHDYAVYVPVFSGHGTPDVDDILNNSPKKWYEDAKKAIEFVKNSGFNTIASFGLSMGGIMATKAATEQLVDYAGTFCSPISVRNPQLPGVLKSFMMYAQAELQWYEEAGHVITVSPVRMEFQETVLSFLNQQEWR